MYLKICLILQIPHEALVASMANLVLYLKAPSVVVHSYAAHTIERILMVKKPDGSGPVWVVIMKLWLHGLKKFVDHAASLRKVEYVYIIYILRYIYSDWFGFTFWNKVLFTKDNIIHFMLYVPTIWNTIMLMRTFYAEFLRTVFLIFQHYTWTDKRLCRWSDEQLDSCHEPPRLCRKWIHYERWIPHTM